MNKQQQLAIMAPHQAMMILAGAGSGKTTVLTNRISHQINVNQIPETRILAVTFTNKAAKEMRLRLESLLNRKVDIWLGTFHGLAHKFLRLNAHHANLPKHFQVMDSSDQLRLIKRLVGELKLDESQYKPSMVASFINKQKEQGLRPHQVMVNDDEVLLLELYCAYQELCQRLGLLDFAELLLRVYELFQNNQRLCTYYKEKFQAVHVDEFQDTNGIQYDWLRLLTEDKDNLFIVGDDDQSIYGWRGARVENMYKFQSDNPTYHLIKLEQNYRSTSTILQAANQVIAKNPNRLGKQLWTENPTGELISVYAARSEQNEAAFVVERIQEWLDAGNHAGDVAILYRSNIQAHAFEEKLLAKGINYKVHGGLRFFDRAEIKDSLAYLRLLVNRHDDNSFERIINTPSRGIGDKTLDDIRVIAQQEECSLWTATFKLLNTNPNKRIAEGVTGFVELIKQLDDASHALPLHEKVKLVIERSGLKAKLDNLNELISIAQQFEYEPQVESGYELDAFLTHTALNSEQEQLNDCVQLMTLHASKGLEFMLVFMVGMEENLFPSKQAITDGCLDEERRLCYVGITRAMQKLYLTHATTRRVFNRTVRTTPSRFIKDIPAHLLKHEVESGKPKAANQATYNVGQTVKHLSFGIGTVIKNEGIGDWQKITVNFDVGVKTLIPAYTKLQIVRA